MKTKTKKILMTLCAMVLSVFMLGGCNLITVNNYKYYNQTVATVNIKDGYGTEYNSYKKTYTKKDLLNSYYNYAYSYVQQGQIDAKSGVEYAMNNMINTDLLYNYIKINFFENDECSVEFTAADANDVKLQAFDSMQNSIYEIEKEIFAEWDIEYLNEDELSDEETESLRASYTKYDSKVEYIEDLNKIILKEGAARVHDSRVAPNHFVQAIRHEAVSREAYTRYVKQLQDNAKAEGASTKEADVLRAEEDRLIDAYTRSRYFEIFEDWYNKYYNFTFDGENYVLNEDVVERVLDTFKQEYEAQEAMYKNNKSAYHSAMGGDDISKVYYHHSDEYVYVSHILLKFSDAQVAEIKELDKKLSKKLISQERYDELVQDIANRTVVTYEIDGQTYTSTAINVYERINGYVNRGADAVEKAKLFNDMIYLYNDDEGIMNKDFAYVVNLDTTVTDKMVKPFADKAREMHNTGNIGDMSDMVITEYGVHIMFYAGNAESVVSDINSLTFADLINTKTQLSSDKSLFDIIYDGISTEAYDTSSTNYLRDIKEAVSIEYFLNTYKDLYE